MLLILCSYALGMKLRKTASFLGAIKENEKQNKSIKSNK
jgi:hypothetical protein